MSDTSVNQDPGARKAARLTYGEQLRHPLWQRKRLEKLSAEDWTCECCMGKEITLHVHHKHYVKGRMAWEYPNGELAVLCENCHESAHEEQVQRNHLFALLPADGPHSTCQAVSLIAGWAYGSGWVSGDTLEFGTSKLSFALGEIAREVERAVRWKDLPFLRQRIAEDHEGFVAALDKL